MSYQTKTLRRAASTPSPFDESYYKTGNYRDYLERKFALLAQEVVAPIDIKISDAILDFGCGCGGLLNALWELGFRQLVGTDCSSWALDEGRRRYPHLSLLTASGADHIAYCDLMTALDVLEHIPECHIAQMLHAFRARSDWLALRIPVCAVEGQPFVLPVSNNDPTHICCHTKQWWRQQLVFAGFDPFHTYSGKAIYDSPGVLAAVYH